MKTFRFQAVISLFLLLGGIANAPAGSVGALEQQVFDLYRLGDSLDPCELKLGQRDLRLTIARALDKRELELDDFIRASARPKRRVSSDELAIGPLSLTPRSEAPRLTGKKIAGGWVSTSTGWDDIQREFANLGGSRVNADWARLLIRVRTTLADDYRRGVRGVWYGVSAEGIAEAPALVKFITACTKDKTKCDGLRDVDSFKNALRLTRKSDDAFAEYEKASGDAARERALDALAAEIKPFLAYYEPVKQSGVRFIDGKTLELTLDAGDFRGYESALTAAIEGFWKIAGNALRIEWTTASRTDPFFKFFYLSSPKSGSQIDLGKRAISLAQGAAEAMPAHFAGRALGFRARFFAVWRPETCRYEDEARPGDLLSDGRGGSVNAAHWASLKKAYAETN